MAKILAGIREAGPSSVAFGALQARNRKTLIQLIKKGLPVSWFSRLQEEMDVPVQALARAANIALRTLARRKKEGKFPADESERVLRLTLLFEKAVDVLGSSDIARRWIKSPKEALGGKTPLDFADTEPGAREVEELLGRIEYGVFS